MMRTSIYNVVVRSCAKARGKSHIASVSSDSLKLKSKRISVQERRALIRAFTEKYQASNGGRFPSVQLVKQELGGSFYTVKFTLQEMEYKQKARPSYKLKIAETNEPRILRRSHCGNKVRNSYSSGRNEALKVAFERITEVECQIENKDVECIDTNPKQLSDEAVTDVGRSFPIEVTGSHAPNDTAMPSVGLNAVADHKVIVASSDVSADEKIAPADVTKKQEIHHEADHVNAEISNSLSSIDNHEQVGPALQADAVCDLLYPDSKEIGKTNTSITEAERIERDHVHQQEKQKSEPEPSPSSDLWVSMKSLAEGFINFWKRL